MIETGANTAEQSLTNNTQEVELNIMHRDKRQTVEQETENMNKLKAGLRPL